MCRFVQKNVQAWKKVSFLWIFVQRATYYVFRWWSFCQAVGETPNLALKHLLKYSGSLIPTLNETSAMGMSVFDNNSEALFSRMIRRYSLGGNPVISFTFLKKAERPIAIMEARSSTFRVGVADIFF